MLAKITEITGQARTGLDDQLRQMTDGVDAFGRNLQRTAVVELVRDVLLFEDGDDGATLGEGA